MARPGALAGAHKLVGGHAAPDAAAQPLLQSSKGHDESLPGDAAWPKAAHDSSRLGPSLLGILLKYVPHPLLVAMAQKGVDLLLDPRVQIRKILGDHGVGRRCRRHRGGRKREGLA